MADLTERQLTEFVIEIFLYRETFTENLIDCKNDVFQSKSNKTKNVGERYVLECGHVQWDFDGRLFPINAKSLIFKSVYFPFMPKFLFVLFRNDTHSLTQSLCFPNDN